VTYGAACAHQRSCLCPCARAIQLECWITAKTRCVTHGAPRCSVHTSALALAPTHVQSSWNAGSPQRSRSGCTTAKSQCVRAHAARVLGAGFQLTSLFFTPVFWLAPNAAGRSHLTDSLCTLHGHFPRLATTRVWFSTPRSALLVRPASGLGHVHAPRLCSALTTWPTCKNDCVTDSPGTLVSPWQQKARHCPPAQLAPFKNHLEYLVYH
jgi:hypothetical protein